MLMRALQQSSNIRRKEQTTENKLNQFCIIWFQKHNQLHLVVSLALSTKINLTFILNSPACCCLWITTTATQTLTHTWVVHAVTRLSFHKPKKIQEPFAWKHLSSSIPAHHGGAPASVCTPLPPRPEEEWGSRSYMNQNSLSSHYQRWLCHVSAVMTCETFVFRKDPAEEQHLYPHTCCLLRHYRLN